MCQKNRRYLHNIDMRLKTSNKSRNTILFLATVVVFTQPSIAHAHSLFPALLIIGTAPIVSIGLLSFLLFKGMFIKRDRKLKGEDEFSSRFENIMIFTGFLLAIQIVLAFIFGKGGFEFMKVPYAIVLSLLAINWAIFLRLRKTNNIK